MSKVHFYVLERVDNRNKEKVKLEMGSCVSCASKWNAHGCVCLLLAGCSGASTQPVLQQLVGDGALKDSLRRNISCRVNNLSQRLNPLSSKWSLRSSGSLRSCRSLRDSQSKNKPQEDDKEEEYRFNLDDVQFILFHPVCSRNSLASTSLRKKMQAYVGKVEMVLFVVPLTWYDDEMVIKDDESKENRMDFALSQFRTLCQIFAKTNAGVGLILEDWAGLVNKLTMPEAGDNIGDHFSDYPIKDEGNPTAAAHYFAERFQEIYDAQFIYNNCFIFVACPDERSSITTSSRENKRNKLAEFLLDSVKSAMISCQLRSLLVGGESESCSITVGKNNRDPRKTYKDMKKGKGDSSKNAHGMATNLNESITSISVTEEYGNTSSGMCLM